MAVTATAKIFIEPDDQYTCFVTYSDPSTGGDTLLTPGQNQTLSVAFNKARDDLASLIVGGIKVKTVTIQMRAE